MNKEKRGLSLTWRRFLIIWAVALLLLGLIGCLVLYRYLGVYEATRPELYMEEFMSSMTVQKLLDQSHWTKPTADRAAEYRAEEQKDTQHIPSCSMSCGGKCILQ